MTKNSRTTQYNDVIQKPQPFSERAQKVLVQALDFLQDRSPGAWSWLQSGHDRLARLGQLLDEFPSLRRSHASDPFQQGLDSLIESLCDLNPLELKLRLPGKAVLAESYWMLQSRYLKDVLTLLQDQQESPPASLEKALFREISHLIHTHLLAQLLIDVILNPDVEHKLKRRAASNLLDLWDQSARQETLSDFFRMIRSLWEARIRIRVQYGTLLGTVELLQLLEAQCDPVVLDFFTQQEVSEEEAYAFQEFLFALSYEEILLLQDYMEQHNQTSISQHDVNHILNLQADSTPPESSRDTDPHKIYRSYKRRRTHVRHRTQTDKPGPRNTAEQLLVLYLLRNHPGF